MANQPFYELVVVPLWLEPGADQTIEFGLPPTKAYLRMRKPREELAAVQLREMQRSRDPGRDKTPAAAPHARASYKDFETFRLELVSKSS